MLVLLHYNFLLLFIIRQRSKTILLTEIIHTDCLHINNGFIKEAAFSAINLGQLALRPVRTKTLNMKV